MSSPQAVLGSAGNAPDAFAPGSKIGRFEVVREIARAGNSVVVRAHDPKLEKNVLLRVLRFAATDPKAAQKISQQYEAAKLASQLNHPNIAQLMGGGALDSHTLYLVCELVEGTLLRNSLNEKHRTAEIVDAARQLTAAFDFAHSRQMTHAALHPGNIMVEYDGTMKVLDFGLVRSGEAEQLTDTRALGRASCSSPEECRGGQVDQRSNLFSLATILYHMATGVNPFAADNFADVVARIQNLEPQPAHELNPGIPPSMSTVIARAMAKDPMLRYATTQEFMRELETASKPAPRPVPAPAVPSFEAPKPAVPPPTPVYEQTIAIPPPKPVQQPTQPAQSNREVPASAPERRPEVAKAKGPAKSNPFASFSQKDKLVIIGAALIVVALAAIFFLTRPKTPAAITPEPPTTTAAEQAQPIPETQPHVNVIEETPADNSSASTRSNTRKQKVAAAPVQSGQQVVTGDLLITSTPSGADISISGRSGNYVTPFQMVSTPVGTYTITFSKPGYVSESRSVEVTRDSKSVVAIQLKPTFATLRVSSIPAGANILVDGRDTGRTTPADIAVEPGSHTLTLKRVGFLEENSTVQARGGENASLSVALKQTASVGEIRAVGGMKKLFGGGKNSGDGIVSVRTNPKGARISVNGTFAPKTTPIEFALAPGHYELMIEAPGAQPVKRVIQVEAGKKLEIDETLRP